jgi:maltose alpha-D-glucosyltransferase/alpha-amylase
MAKRERIITIEKDPLWYKDAIIYELHVRSFLDSNADGIGDFRGLTQKLDYLQDLGVTAVWILPFYPSPLKDDGYDIADYYTVNPIYGTVADFKSFLREAHIRGLRVITELVINHTSDQHPWFQRARRAKPGSAQRDYYVWSDNPQKYKEARIIFRDFEPSNWSWDPVAQAYFWHRFYSHQPDLNYDNPEVHNEISRILDFWMDMGVDGLRLDAIPYLYEREGTSCENLPETHKYLKSLRAHVDQKYGDRMLLAEANQWPEDAVSYLGQGKGDECHMGFHFPVMPRLFMALRMEDRVPIVDIMDQTPPIPETSQWAIFLRNHDELTLEMVTDEERDYMYRVYAADARARINLGIRRRLSPLLGNDRRRIELLNLLLFSLPGTPVLYYGDEIGMGDNTFLGDRNGVRTPMQWSSDKNAGFSRANPHALFLPVILDPEYHYETANVEAQERNPNSLLWWTKRAVALRKKWKAFGQGTLEFLHPENRKVLAFLRQYKDEVILVVANLSRFPQAVELDLLAYNERVPVELFGRTEFPQISTKPYLLTLSPHAAFWFSLQARIAAAQGGSELPAKPPLRFAEEWKDFFDEGGGERLERILPEYLALRRWFGAKGKEISSVQVRDVITIPNRNESFFITILTVEFAQGDPEDYLLPVGFAGGKAAELIRKNCGILVITAADSGQRGTHGIIYDAIGNKHFSRALLDVIGESKGLSGREGQLHGEPTEAFIPVPANAKELAINTISAEQSNSGVIFGQQYILKFFRKLAPGINPDLEIGRFLTEKGFANTARVAGALIYRQEGGEVLTLGILSELIPNATDTWVYTVDTLGRFFDRASSSHRDAPLPSPESLLALQEKELPEQVSSLLGTYTESARLLGVRTAQMHKILASDRENKDFAPEAYTPFYQRSLFQSMRNLTVQTLHLLRRRMKSLDPRVLDLANEVSGLESELLQKFREVTEKPLSAMRIRVHGDYHLGQVLYTGKDFIIIDFEGEPARPLGERRIKRTALRDVAGMVRSFHYAAYSALFEQVELGKLPQEKIQDLEEWANFWFEWVSAIFVAAYTSELKDTDILPAGEGLMVLLYASLLEKAVYEVAYELNNRPDWVAIPLRGILHLLGKHACS